jgi:hypothetical protein
MAILTKLIPEKYSAGCRGRIMIRRSDQLRLALTALLIAAVGIASCGSAFSQDEVKNDPAVTAAEQLVESALSEEEPVESAIADDASREVDSEEARAARRQKVIDEENEKEKLRKSALAGLLVLSLICIVFLVLIILVALWARRIRMLTREPVPGLHPGDPLWYLRKGKGSDSPDIVELTDGGSSHGES